MRAITREWVDKAEADYDVILVLLRSRRRGRVGAICFHAQQCAEKYLKGRLAEAQVPFPKTHFLADLLAIVQPIEPLWVAFAAELSLLSPFAVDPRYPGRNPSVTEMRAAVRAVRRFRTAARAALGI